MATVIDTIIDLLRAYDDPKRAGLQGTPERVQRMYAELLIPQQFNFTTFPSNGSTEMIIQKHIPFHSLCEHHMLPFYGMATVAYIPSDCIAGLSKLARTVTYCSRALQTQEDMTKKIEEMLQEKLNPVGVAVRLSAQHMCMAMRGCVTQGTMTITSRYNGVFTVEQELRNEFIAICKGTE